LVNATIQDPIYTAVSAYILKNLINGTNTNAVAISGTPIITTTTTTP
jgi:hypothetical protein